jgi:hypothetical protein
VGVEKVKGQGRVLAAVGLDLHEVVANTVDGVRSGFAQRVGEGFVKSHLSFAREGALIIMVSKYSRVWNLALSEWFNDFEKGLSRGQ